jgi:hypothetical protein
VITSNDGITWATITAIPFSCTLLVYGNGRWLVNRNNFFLHYSDNGITWTQCTTSDTIVSKYVTGAAYGNGLWVATGIAPAGVFTLVSTDNAVSWSLSGGGNGSLAIAFNGSTTWVCSHQGGPTIGGPSFTSKILWSDNGTSWNNATLMDGSTVIPFTLNDVGYAGGLWLGICNDGVYTSTDGKRWVKTSSNVYSKLTYGSRDWIAVGFSLPARTRNGVTWTNIQIDASGNTNMGYVDIDYFLDYGNNGMFVVAGRDSVANSNRLYYSTDNANTWNSTIVTLGLGGGFTYVKSRRELPPPSPPCFVQGTRVLTPTGYKQVEDLDSGDRVLTADNRSVSIDLYTYTIAKATTETAPYRIPVGALGANVPAKDLCVSPRHAVKDSKGRWQIPKYLGEKAKQYGVGEPVTYYHIECPNYYTDNLIVEGTVVESFKNRQGTKGVIYMWDENMGGWERLPPNKMTTVPENPKTYMIYSW